MKLPSPSEIKTSLPLQNKEKITFFRKQAKEILTGKDPRLVSIVGPCSVHDQSSALTFANKLKDLSKEIKESFFPIMRVFFEKPRTTLGWKGLLYDPFLDGTYDIVEGIRKSRSLILQILEIGIPCASELLDPILLPYFDDLLVWGLIGARTSASQPHRQMASGLNFPIGFKNDCEGNIDVAISGILTSRISHTNIGIDSDGHIAKIQTRGNPYSHLVLRGSESTPNFDQASVKIAQEMLKKQNLEQALIIDCSHGNSGKDFSKQKDVFYSVLDQAEKNPNIRGLMLESHLFEGKQPFADLENLRFGVSITDACIGWDETQDLLRSRSINFVQK